MPIQVSCPSCDTVFRVADAYAGKRGKCPRCKASIEVPVPAPAPAPAPAAEPPPAETETYDLADGPVKVKTVGVGGAAAPKGTAVSEMMQATEPNRPSQSSAQIFAAFQGTIDPVRPTLLYRIWILIVAGMMLLLPVLYVALVGLVIVAIGFYAVHGTALLHHVHNTRVALVLYVAPLVAGVVVVAFMLKPLFARPGKKAKTRQLDPSKEPLLFAFVDGVCSSVGAPRPSRIEVDCQVNAAAYLIGGPLAVFNNELALQIGLPLVAGLSLRQFAGVLAHELGHFSQRAGMRLSYVIWSINHWFARVVYERDSWDEMLVSWSRSGNVADMFISWLVRGAVWLTRRVLWVLMYVGHFVSGFLSRQMEFDADRYQARMVGSTAFAQTMERVEELSVAAQGAYADLVSSWQDGRLPDHLPVLILANVPQIPPPVRSAMQEAMRTKRTGLFDTHPADKDRIARAQAEGAAGIFTLDGPATDLFRNYDTLAKAATFDQYRALLGPDITKDKLYPVAVAVQGQAVAQQASQAFDRYFLECFSLLQPLPLPAEYPTAPADLKDAKRKLVEARKAMEARRSAHTEALQKWDSVHGLTTNAEMAVALLKAGNRIKLADFNLKTPTLEAARAASEKASAAFQSYIASLEPFERAAAKRLSLALSLLESDAVAAKVPDGPARRAEAHALYPCVTHLGNRVVREFPAVLRAQRVLASLLERFQKGLNEKNEPLINACLRAGGQLREQLSQFQWKLGQAISYPFEHARDEISLADFALPQIPTADEVGSLLQASEGALNKLTTLYHRALGRLAMTAEEVERAVGLPPLASAEKAAPDAAAVQAS